MEFKKIAVSKLTMNTGQIEGVPANPRQWTQADLDRLAASIEETPELLDARGAIVVPHKGKFVVLGGNMRLTAAKKLGLAEMPCAVLPEDTPIETLKAVVIKDNSSMGAWDFDALANEWDDLPLTDWGVPAWKTENETEEDAPQQVEEDDFNEETDAVETRCKAGDIWQLGEHMLMCGDSTKLEDVQKLTGGAKIDISFTSPPYGVGLDYNEYNDTFENTKNLVNAALPLMAKFTSDYVVLNWGDIVSAKEINHTEQPSMFSWMPLYLQIMRSAGWNLWAERIWKKPHARCSGIWSASSNRPVSDWEYIFTFANRHPSFNERCNGSHFGIIDSSEDTQSDTLSQHPGAFPVYIAARVILIHTIKGASVLDLFCGSGTTLIAAEQLGRKCYGMELDPHYCDIIIARWEKFTGQQAKKIN